MANAISTGRRSGGVCYGGKGLTSGWRFIGCIRPSIKLIHPRWQPMAQGRKTRCILFTPLSQLPTLLVGLSVTELFILCPALPFLSDTHYVHALFPPHTHFCVHQPTQTSYITGWEFISLSEWKSNQASVWAQGSIAHVHRLPFMAAQ